MKPIPHYFCSIPGKAEACLKSGHNGHSCKIKDKEKVFLKLQGRATPSRTAPQSRQRGRIDNLIEKTRPLGYLLAVVVCLSSAASSIAADKGGVDPQKEEFIEIMKRVNFVPQLNFAPQLGKKYELFCKSFYEDFKKQAKIEHIQPILKAEKYDDPALQPYQEKCPKLDFRMSLTSNYAHGPENWTEEDWESMGIPVYGLGNFQLYKFDINNMPDDGEEYVFYYEGQRMIDRQLPFGGPMIEVPVVNPGTLGYHALDFKKCKRGGLGVSLNQGGSVNSGTRNGVIRYQGKNAIYILKDAGTKQPDFLYLEIHMYSKKLKHIAPVCTYVKPH